MREFGGHIMEIMCFASMIQQTIVVGQQNINLKN